MLIDEQAREIPADAALHLLLGLVAKHAGRAGPDRDPAQRVARRGADRRRYEVAVERAGITQAGLIEAAAARRACVRRAPRTAATSSRSSSRASTR